MNIVIGAGPTGLSCAYAMDALVLEKDSVIGGLCRSIHHMGGTWDIGGHSWHSPHPDVLAFVEDLMDEALEWQQRKATCYVKHTKQLIPYPFQQHYEQITDRSIVEDCRVKGGSDDRNFDAYLHKFGPGIYRHFLGPYNRKLWARDLRTMACDWTMERVADTARQSQKDGQRKALESDSRVGYPQMGGFDQITWRLASRLRYPVRLSTGVRWIDPRNRTLGTLTGEVLNWDTLVSTMPLTQLVQMVQTAPLSIVVAANGLEALSLNVDMILVDHPLETDIQRIYVADPDVPAHKIALNHNSSTSLRGRQRHAIIAESSYGPEKPAQSDSVARNVDFLHNLGLIDRKDVIWSQSVRVEHGYPVYTLDRAERVRIIREWLETKGIYTAGRFGDWEYRNSDWCIRRGLELGKQIASGRAA